MRALALAAFVFSGGLSHGDEGYWLFSNPPLKLLAEKYQFTSDEAWFAHLRGACVKIGGGSGSFVSANGLVITNRHVVEGELHAVGSRDHDYEHDGFYATTRDRELPCPGLELRILEHTEDVTARVATALKPGQSPEESEAAHRAKVAEIEKESFDRTGLISEVVTLFGGARYDLYQYKKFNDVRLVFAPEQQVGFFGGDVDNFEYPRYDLDVSFVRVYDHGQPVDSRDYLKWNTAGPAADELIFVVGHPGLSQRLVTMDEIEFQRDARLPFALDDMHRMEQLLTKFSATSKEHARQAASALAGVANSRKATNGFLNTLREPGLIANRAAEEKSFIAALMTDPKQAAGLDAYKHIHDAVAADRKNMGAYQLYERFAGRSDLVNIARTLVRAAGERAKPNGERLPAYRDNALPSLQFRLFSGRPFYPALETLFIADALEQLQKQFGENDPLVNKLLADETPRARAEELVKGSHLEDASVRKKIYLGGAKALQESGDPMLAFAKELEPAARAARDIDDRGEHIRGAAYADIYQARLDLHKAADYPDATGTLRLAFGTVTGYEGIKPFTDFAGLYARCAQHRNQPPFDLPSRWIDVKAGLDPATPLNFITTADILGGNSGSPVVNRAGEFTGIIFDGNEPSLAGRYVYDTAKNRSVAVDSAAITAALRKIYKANALADELMSGNAP